MSLELGVEVCWLRSLGCLLYLPEGVLRNTLFFSNQKKDSPGFQVRHCCHGNQREWANQQGQNKPTDAAHTFITSCDGADKAHNYRRGQPPEKKQHFQAL